MLVVLGIILIVLGAVVSFAINTSVEGVELVVVGYILITAGVISLIAAAIKGAGWLATGNSSMRSERHVSPDGNHVVEETDIS